MKPQLILIGAPGAGKGTQALKLKSEQGYNHVSTGDLLRAEIQKGTELGKKVEKIMSDGALVDDQTVLDLLKANCDLDRGGYIFDGFPRNEEQANALSEQLLKDRPYMAVYFEIDLGQLTQRLVNRRICGDCGAIYNLVAHPPKEEGTCDKCGGGLSHRKDDQEDVVKNRLEVFEKTVGPMIDYYEKLGKLKRLQANTGPEELYQELLGIIG